MTPLGLSDPSQPEGRRDDAALPRARRRRTPHRLLVGLLAVAALPLAATTAASAAPASASGATTSRISAACDAAPAGYANCFALRNDTVTARGDVVPNAAPRGYGPADVHAAYALGSAKAGGRTVAIVDAYDDPKAEADLKVYRARYGLPACTTANGCFKKIDQRGGKNYPAANGGWAQEISLDLDMVSAACPSCKILLVEADDPSFANLGAAVNTAARLKPSAISNSYGSSGDIGANQLPAAYYDHPGIAITASTGDNGYNVSAPASFRTVIAVGGTSLRRNGSARGWTESAWSGAGSGCSSLNPKPAWQTAATKCKGKANADVSAVADPNTGVAVYDSFAYQGVSGWLVFGGTSASSPIIASVYALSGRTAQYPAAYTWAHKSALYDVTSGSNGSCSPAVLCHAGPGWDGPTGLGTPKGIAAF